MANEDLKLPFGSSDLQLPDELRAGLHAHLHDLKQ